jgi:tetratricopeptide (TPR) repeat protein
MTYHNLGFLHRNSQEPKQAQANYEKALPIREQLAREHPEVLFYQEQLGRLSADLALGHQDSGRWDQARAAYEKPLKIFAQLSREHPEVPAYQQSLARTYGNLGLINANIRQAAQAREALEKALALFTQLARDHPDMPEYREDETYARKELAGTLLDLGDHAGAAGAAGELARVASDPVGDAYKAAGFFARCVPLAEKDGKLPEVKRQELARSYGDRALEALRQAVAKGYKDAAHMQKDKDLDPLRGRDDFKKLLAELEKEPEKQKPKSDRP